jgi:hypothetical protein
MFIFLTIYIIPHKFKNAQVILNKCGKKTFKKVLSKPNKVIRDIEGSAESLKYPLTLLFLRV